MNDKIIVKNIENIKPKYKNEFDGYEYNKYEVTKRKDFSQAYICFYEIMLVKQPFLNIIILIIQKLFIL